MTWRTKTGMGSLLATLGGLGVFLWLLFGSTAFPDTSGSILGFVLAVLTGLGATLAVSGLIERRRSIR